MFKLISAVVTALVALGLSSFVSQFGLPQEVTQYFPFVGFGIGLIFVK